MYAPEIGGRKFGCCFEVAFAKLRLLHDCECGVAGLSSLHALARLRVDSVPLFEGERCAARSSERADARGCLVAGVCGFLHGGNTGGSVSAPGAGKGSVPPSFADSVPSMTHGLAAAGGLAGLDGASSGDRTSPVSVARMEQRRGLATVLTDVGRTGFGVGVALSLNTVTALGPFATPTSLLVARLSILCSTVQWWPQLASVMFSDSSHLDGMLTSGAFCSLILEMTAVKRPSRREV